MFSNHQDHLQYFGFALTDYVPDRFGEIDSFVNLTDLSLVDYSNIKRDVIQLASSGNSVIVHLQGIFIDSVPDLSSPTGVNYQLVQEYRSDFKRWCENNADLPVDHIVAFTIADEPCWNNVDMSELFLIARLVKSVFPTVRIMLIESYEALDELELSSDIDWVGFDRYGTPDPLHHRDSLNSIEKIKRLFSSKNQKIVLIMETQWLPLYSELGYQPQNFSPSMC